MNYKIVILFTSLLALGVLQSYEYYSSRKISNSKFENRTFRAQIIESSDLSKTREKINNRRLKRFNRLAEEINYLAYLPNETFKNDFKKISIAKEETKGLSFQEWLDTYAKGDEVTTLIESRPTIVANKEAALNRYDVSLHDKSRLSVIYIDFTDSIISLGIYGELDKSFEDLEAELERFANEL